MKFAKLDKDNKVINILVISHKDVYKLENDLNIVDITNIKEVNYGCIWNPKTKTFSIPEKTQKEIDIENEKSIYDEVRELKEKIEKYELSSDVSAGLK